jgi:hypothetical protein
MCDCDKNNKQPGRPKLGDDCLDVTIGFAMSKKHANILKKHSDIHDLSQSEVIRRAVLRYLRIDE